MKTFHDRERKKGGKSYLVFEIEDGLSDEHSSLLWVHSEFHKTAIAIHAPNLNNTKY